MKLKSLHLYRLFAILLLYLLLGLAYSMAVPLGEAPDEVDHFRYVQYLVQEQRFPVLSPVSTDNFTMEANQPPLFYVLAAVLTGWVDMAETADFPPNTCFSFDPQDPGRQHFYLHTPAEQFPYRGTFLAFHLARVLSLVLGAATVVLAYGLGREIVPDDWRVAPLAAALLAFNPQFIFITASVNNDVLTALLGAAMVLLSIMAARRPSRPLHAGLGVVVGLGLLTKFALFALWPIALLAALWPIAADWRQGEAVSILQSFLRGLRTFAQDRSPIPNLFLVLGLPVLIAGWWYWRAQQLYGDPLAWTVHLQAKGDQVLRLEPLAWHDLLDFIQLHFQSYWALFGWLNIAVPAWIYLGLAAIILLAVAGLVKEVGDRLPLILTILAVTAIYVSLLHYIQTINWSGYQGRLAYAVAAPIAALLALGLVRVAGRLALWLIPLALFLLALGSLVFVIAPAYPRPAIYQPDPTLPRTCARFAGGLALEALQAPARLRPGEIAPITIYGFGLDDSHGRQRVRLQVSGRDGTLAGVAETGLSWRAGDVVSATLLMPIGADAEPARALMQAGLLAGPEEWQAAHNVDGRTLDLPVTLATVKIPPRQPLAPTPQHPVSATFGDEMRLLGYDLAAGEMAMTVTLYWQNLSSTAVDYTTFVHLLDSHDQLASQDDSQPQAGAYPTSIWDVGEVVADVKQLKRPETSSGPFRLAVGVYEPDTLQRLPVQDAAGVLQANDLLILATRVESAAGP